MITMQELTFEERVDYKDHLRLTCRIACSFSRLDAIVYALSQISSAERYEATAYEWCKESIMYVFDEEGYCTQYEINGEDENGPTPA